MGLYKYYPVPSDRMGALWTLLPIKGGCILEFGTSGTTRFALNSFSRMQGEQNSRIYSTHMDENDIAMGQVIRLEKAMEEILKTERPPVIFVMPSTLSATIGTDIASHCSLYQEKYPDIKILPLKSDGFRGNWTQGVREVLELLVCNLPEESERTQKPTFNIIGSCADDYNYFSDSYEIIRMLKEGFNAVPLCVMTSDTHISDIKAMGGAHVNIVLRQEGIEAARRLEERFGTPYVAGRPYGLKASLQWMEQVSERLKIKCDAEYMEYEQKMLSGALKIASAYASRIHEPYMAIGGHFDIVKGLLDFAKEEVGFVPGAVWCTSPDRADESIPFYKESQWEEAVTKGQYGIIMSNAVALHLAKQDCRKIQIDIPSYEFCPIKYPYTPYVGFRGAQYLLNKWINPPRYQ